MARLIVWRLARTLVAVWALASLVFLLSYRDRNTATELALPDAADLRSRHNATNPAGQLATRQAIQHRLGLDRPLFYVSRLAASPPSGVQWHWNGRHNQYHRWAVQLLHGNMGTSFRTGQPVAARLREALAMTLPLTGTAALLAVLAALALAVRLAAAPWWQRPVRAALVAVHAMPLFVLALALLFVFANPEVLAWFPAYGLDQDTELSSGQWLATYLLHLVLPGATLALAALPELALQLEASLVQELHAGYVATARAKGLPENAIIRRHALRNALLPSLSQLAELLPALVAGALVVEVVFALPGMGRLLAEAAAARDYPVLVGGVLLVGVARLLALLLADLLYLWTDPRIRWQS
ncbi:ABC transporter permease [Hymenobacter rubidus]|uniref:ABC transporter permease n=1 Tax=Hymenobacter rubidus TaxID=1441626 RepID=UPI0019201996|nr:ABC transporter permease [Hymenobacter rubidus]